MVRVLRGAARGALDRRACAPDAAAGGRLRPPRRAGRPTSCAAIRQQRPRRHGAGQPDAAPRPAAAAGRAVGEVRRARRATPDPELAAEAREGFDEDVVHRDGVPRVPGRLVARADPARGARRDGRRAAARPLGAPRRCARARPGSWPARCARLDPDGRGPAVRARRRAAGRAADAARHPRAAQAADARRTRSTSSPGWRS